MNLHKDQAREYEHNGYKYIYMDDDYIYFQKTIYKKAEQIDEKTWKTGGYRYIEIKLFEEDLLNGNYKDMMEHNISRTENSIKNQDNE